MSKNKVFKKELFYNNSKVTCVLSKYNNPVNNALIMVNEEDEHVATCSTNIEFELANNEIFIKNYSENEGILDFLVENNIVKTPKKCLQSGYVMIPICELNVDEFIEFND